MALRMFALAQGVGVENVVLIFFVVGYFIAQVWFKLLSVWLPVRRESSPKEGSASTYEQGGLCSSSLEDDRQTATSIARPLPEDLCGRIAVHCGFQGVGALAASCKIMQLQLWESQEVWLALSMAFRLPSASVAFRSACLCCPGRDARDAFRRAHFRTDLAELRALVAVGRPQPILEEAAHVACGLLPGDLPLSGLSDFIQMASRSLGAHDPERLVAIAAAEQLLRAARRCMELFTEEQLENLEYAYNSVHQLHSLMLSSMRNSYEEVLEQSFWQCQSPADDQEHRELVEAGSSAASGIDREYTAVPLC